MNEIFLPIDDLLTLTHHKKGVLIGVDFGTKMIGLARCDRLMSFAHPWCLHERVYPVEKDWKKFADTVAQESMVIGLVWGWPVYTQTGTVSSTCKQIETYITGLKDYLPYPQFRWDERFSSQAVGRLHDHANQPCRKQVNKKKHSPTNKKNDLRHDHQAAAFTLQGVLDYLRLKQGSLSILLIFWVGLSLSSCGGRGEYTGEMTSVGGVCKSCKPYFCRGDWHTPQLYYEYNETGLASWYGPGFYNKPKATGERYDAYQMVAAHRTLPLPTIARVTHTPPGQNSRSVTVLIDDRGPYTYSGRIIDLSVMAAKTLGTYSRGVCEVKVESLVKESRALSDYLAKFKKGRCPMGRSWLDVYNQDVAPMMGAPLINKVSYESSEEMGEGTAVPLAPPPQAIPPVCDKVIHQSSLESFLNKEAAKYKVYPKKVNKLSVEALLVKDHIYPSPPVKILIKAPVTKSLEKVLDDGNASIANQTSNSKQASFLRPPFKIIPKVRRSNRILVWKKSESVASIPEEKRKR